jgi:hypothetical protein
MIKHFMKACRFLWVYMSGTFRFKIQLVFIENLILCGDLRSDDSLIVKTKPFLKSYLREKVNCEK